MTTNEIGRIAVGGARRGYDAALEFTKSVLICPFAPGATARRNELAGFLRVLDDRKLKLDPPEVKLDASKVNQRVKHYLGTRNERNRDATEVIATPFIVALLLAHMELNNVVSTKIDREFYTKWTEAVAIPYLKPAVLLSTAFRLFRVKECINRIRGTSAIARDHRQRVWQLSVGGAPYALPKLDPILRKTSVHITGESGTGKELVAQAILAAVPVDEELLEPKPTESISLAGIPESLMYMELFGAAKGAATGVLESKGLFERTNGGAAFIDEVAELSVVAQAAMLRTLETGLSKRLGAAKTLQAKPRVVSATHENLRDMVGKNKFRQDLYYRLCAQEVCVPSLRERKEDIPVIIEGLAARMGLESEIQEELVKEACNTVKTGTWSTYTWPGNVRELDGFVKAVAIGLPISEPSPRAPSRVGGVEIPDGLKLASWSRKDLERWYARRVMSNHETKGAAADILGVTRNTFNKMLKG